MAGAGLCCACMHSATYIACITTLIACFNTKRSHNRASKPHIRSIPRQPLFAFQRQHPLKCFIMAVMDTYTWIFAVSVIVAFLAAFGIGANDLANSFGSSVGTKALTMWQCVIIASVCEFCGALFLGASVTNTIKSGITNVNFFKPYPALFMYGFFAVLCAAAFWDNFAAYLEFPVSTTHTTVGAIIGMTLVLGGGDAVVWSASKSSFPYFQVGCCCGFFCCCALTLFFVSPTQHFFNNNNPPDYRALLQSSPPGLCRPSHLVSSLPFCGFSSA